MDIGDEVHLPRRWLQSLLKASTVNLELYIHSFSAGVRKLCSERINISKEAGDNGTISYGERRIWR